MEDYFRFVMMIERLHRLFLEVMKAELDRMKIFDINNVQCLMLYKVGSEQVTIGDLKSRGYYLGSNVSYSLNMMLKNKYLLQKPVEHDLRARHIKLSEKGLKLYDRLDGLFATHAKALALEGAGIARLDEMNDLLASLEGFWKGALTRWDDRF